MRHAPFTIRWITLTAVCLLSLSACATLDQSECQQANWRAIGFEDGSKGELPSRIGRHRKACAKHGVTPDLAAYQDGHRQGLEQFCTEPNGFRYGKSGRAYNGVCPAELDPPFLAGYRKGKELHTAKQHLSQAESTLASHQRDLERIDKKIAKTEQQLISSATSEVQRKTLLTQLKDLQHQQIDLESEIPFLQQTVDDKKALYNDLRQRYVY